MLRSNLVDKSKAIVLGSLVVMAVVACSKGADSTRDTTQASQATNPNAPVVVRGVVQTVSSSQVALKVDTGVVTVALAQPFHVYARAASDMAHVTANSFIGVTTVKQPDGSERATEIHVFPEELRGLGEGSRMMGRNPNAAASRMTNGNVSQSRMTNGNVSQSRMSNGNVASTTGSTLVVEYAGGSQNVTVPPNTPVTELKAVSKPLAVGDSVALVVKLGADGTLSSDKAISTKR